MGFYLISFGQEGREINYVFWFKSSHLLSTSDQSKELFVLLCFVFFRFAFLFFFGLY